LYYSSGHLKPCLYKSWIFCHSFFFIFVENALSVCKG
jgi:hypothetical protein